MRFSDIRDATLTGLYRRGAFASEQAVAIEMLEELSDCEAVRREIVLKELADTGLVASLPADSLQIFFLTINGIYRAEETAILEARATAKEHGTLASRLSVYSIASAAYLALLVFLPSYFNGFIEASCRVNSAQFYGGVWAKGCEHYAIRYSPDLTILGELFENPVFWAVVLAMPLAAAILVLNRRFRLGSDHA